MERKLVERINFLAKKSKTPQGLTEEEKTEQQTLRKQYIEEWKRGVTQTLDSVYIVDADGKETKLVKKENGGAKQ
mgnify:CR=1 FL=1